MDKQNIDSSRYFIISTEQHEAENDLFIDLGFSFGADQR